MASRVVPGARAAVVAGVACVGSAALAIDLQNATATYSQTTGGDFFASTMIDGGLSNSIGWAIWDSGANTTSAEIAAFETVADLNAPAIRVNMLQNYFFDNAHLVGRFRFSATSDDRSTFCDGLQIGGDVSADWTVLTPVLETLPPGTTATVLPDMSVLLGGDAMNGSYVFTCNLPIANVTGFRLEVMEDPTLPTDGPGRQPVNGNFVIAELFVTALPCAADLTTGAVSGQPGYGIANGIINNDDFFFYLAQFAAGNVAVADLTTGAIPGQAGYGVPNGVLTNDDFFFYLAAFAAGC